MVAEPRRAPSRKGTHEGMTGTPPAPFDFAALDDLAFAADRGRLAGRELPRVRAGDIGPVIELSQLATKGLLPGPREVGWLDLKGLENLMRAYADGKTRWVCRDIGNMGFLRTRTVPPADETVWTGFGLAAQKAATAAGFPRGVAAQLTAVLGELHTNVYEHSGAPETGLIAFRAQANRFEFVVADSGIGVLESLRSYTEFAGLCDHGEALRLALTDGVSRYGPAAGRGQGFRPLFIGLANLNGALRFRSGDHALLIDGQNPSLMTARPAQKPPIPGFLVSVSCEALDHA